MLKLNFDVKKHYLDNGLEILTIKKDTQIASINLGVKVGSIYESLEEKGISHFIEHMLFKGTNKRNNEELNDELEALGGEYNAYTDYNSTVYTISCLSEELENACILLGDMITSSNFPEEEIERERGVILAEMRTSKDDIEDLSFKRVNEVAFNSSPLRYDVTGLEEVVKGFKRDDIKRFYNKYYTPKNSLITMVSSMEHEEAKELINREFSNWQGEEEVEHPVISEDNIPLKKVSYKNDMEQSTIVYLYTFYHLDKNDELALRILNHRLGESSNSLLFREVREKKGLAYDIYTHLDMTKNVKTLYVYTAVSDEDVEEAIRAIDETLDKVFNGKIEIGNKDLTIMKKVHKTAVISTLEDSAELCNYILHQELEGEDIYEFVKDMEGLNNLNRDKIYKVSKLVLKDPTIHILTSPKE
ncbi:MAG: pitrilysin family protein [Clostridium sp.]|uniref:M16 family metallopeptidase n=1 Tax=Clostridium TaxID=1485 RepID=UPI0018A0A332|nr:MULTISPECIES: pitrilysin family protein [Clostridium]MDB2085298.1 pitrilysin family protein [Clostridium paraputrificum]MDU5740058.1 pitrilysin family protein [Clostridium sp.]MDU5784170.1 pitrilysin family protein [Clostridium sp.]